MKRILRVVRTLLLFISGLFLAVPFFDITFALTNSFYLGSVIAGLAIFLRLTNFLISGILALIAWIVFGQLPSFWFIALALFLLGVFFGKLGYEDNV